MVPNILHGRLWQREITAIVAQADWFTSAVQMQGLPKAGQEGKSGLWSSSSRNMPC